jgi:hypothetical protein
MLQTLVQVQMEGQYLVEVLLLMLLVVLLLVVMDKMECL